MVLHLNPAAKLSSQPGPPLGSCLMCVYAVVTVVVTAVMTAIVNERQFVLAQLSA